MAARVEHRDVVAALQQAIEEIRARWAAAADDECTLHADDVAAESAAASSSNVPSIAASQNG